MVEHQSCTSLANASALCVTEGVKGDNANIITEISAELKRERQKNAELMKRISILEAQINEERKKDHSMLSNGQVVFKNSRGRCIRKFKRQKIDEKIKMDSETKTGSESQPNEDICLQDRLVNWMSTEGTPSLHSERLKDSGSSAENDLQDDGKVGVGINSLECDRTVKEQFPKDDIPDEKGTCLNGISNCYSEAKHAQELNEDLKEKILQTERYLLDKSDELKKLHKETEIIGRYKQISDVLISAQKVKENGISILQRKPPKVAFCPKEVKRILQSEALSKKNAQAHTIRKIIVFASLGIRHGFDDMYELDFSQFSILQKGEPYVSPQNPGEHVLYENPGVRRKIFYPNRWNPTLCPVQVLEEERAMRPSDVSCPSCLFLCIKYGGRTRNLPQNEYVRQRMGRNKLKSFGPVICRMAMLTHIRSGSFFFKALGITLLFMAGFPDDLVQRETKYRNLDLLQKYYRRDEDAEGEELFLSHPLTNDTNPTTKSSKRIDKMISRESKNRRHTSSTRRPHEKSCKAESVSGSSVPPKQSKLMGYGSTQVYAMTSLQTVSSHPTADTMPMPNAMAPASSYHNQYSCPVFPPQTANSCIPMVYWPPLNALPACSYASSCSYKYPAAGNYIPIYPQSYYSHPSCIPPHAQPLKDNAITDVVPEDADSESNSSTSSREPKEE